MAAANGNPAAAVTADLSFHRALLPATHNELLERMEVVLETGLAERDRLVHGGEPVPLGNSVTWVDVRFCTTSSQALAACSRS
ncbi:FCD domain-containing protein [Micromonospora sp. U21]|uniref:FCD domain-containing protein n=1 Tax=Micromonospora sp. U21 TaxID=2824899 RepID=UPI001FFD918D|nr:FCD domain-containing protein [Micromonospora sp. U21]